MKNSEKIFESLKKGVINENLTGYVDLQPINRREQIKISFIAFCDI